MTGQFDQNGDLWIEIAVADIPTSIPASALSGVSTAGATYGAVTDLNLTAYMRHLRQPDWLNAALTPASAQITIVGNTPTTGGANGS